MLNQSTARKKQIGLFVNYINAIEDFIEGQEKPEDHQKQPEKQQEKSKMKKNLSNVKKISQAMDTTQEKTK